MSNHLPECDSPSLPNACICPELRAFEQRVRNEYRVGHADYASGLDAAREAVAAVENDPDAEIDYDRDYTADPSGNTRNPRIWLRDALAAIDALREGTK